MIKYLIQKYVSKFALYIGIIKACPIVNYPIGMFYYMDYYRPNKYIHIIQ